MEFLRRKLRPKREQTIMGPRAVFSTFDADGSGAISMAELKEALTKSLGSSTLSDAEAQAIVSEFDFNGDGELQYEEFAVMWGTMTGEPGTTSDEEAKESRVEAALGGKAREGPSSPGASSFKNGGSSFKRGTSSLALGDGDSVRSKKDEASTSKKVVLLSQAELKSAAVLEQSAREDLERRAATVLRSTFNRRLGQALKCHDIAAGARKGSKDALSELLREWDTNKDGSLNKVELRTAVRGPKLKLKRDCMLIELDCT